MLMNVILNTMRKSKKCQVKLGAKTFQTPVVPDDLNPTFKSEVRK